MRVPNEQLLRTGDHSCSKCGRTFSQKSNLAVHQRKHSGEWSFKCEICCKTFMSAVSVRAHAKLHSDRRPFTCQVCGKSFKYLSVLESHRTIHTREVKYSCGECGKLYRYRASLFIHMRTHTGHRPYKCGGCSAAFLVKSHLTDHLRIHSGERPFECEVCSVSFSRTVSLKKHLKAHLREGLKVDLDLAMHKAKVKAKVQKSPHGSVSAEVTSVVTHGNAEREDGPPLIEKVVLCPDPLEDDGTCVVLTLSSIGDGSVCSHTVRKPNHGHRDSTQGDTAQERDTVHASLSLESAGITSASGRKGVVYLGDVGHTRTYRQNSPLEAAPTEQVLHGRLGHESCGDVATPENAVCGKLCEDLPDSNLKEENECKIADFTPAKDSQNVLETPRSLCRTQMENIRDALDAGVKRQGGVVSASGARKSHRAPLQKCHYYDATDYCSPPLDTHKTKHNGEGSGEEGELVSIPEAPEPTRPENSQCPFRCRECNISFPFRSELRKHMKQHSSRYRHTCPRCHQAFQQQGFLAKHQCVSQHSLVPSPPTHTTSHASSPISTPSQAHLSTPTPSQGPLPTYSSPQSLTKATRTSELKQKCDQCRVRFNDARHRKHTGERPFTCKECNNKSFILATHQRVHARLHTSKERFKCPMCRKPHRRKLPLQQHLAKCQGMPQTVLECGSDSNDIPPELMLSIKSENGVLVCNVHQVKGSLPTAGLGHVTKEESACQIIEGDLRVEVEDETNSLQVVKDETVLLEIKETDFTGENLHSTKDLTSAEEEKGVAAALEESEKRETGCEFWGEAATEPLKHTSRGLLRCTYCPRAFRYRSLVAAHERTHTGERPFHCPECGKGFSKKGNMETHIRTHTGERPFLCDVCGKRFSHRYSLEAHRRLHTQEKPFVCSICGKTFRHEASRQVHLKRHKGEKAFKCDLCPKAFVTKVDLGDHRRTHTKERPYQCDQCQRRFTVRHHLADHRRLHTGEWPHKCQLCGATFLRAKSWKIHIQKHTDFITETL